VALARSDSIRYVARHLDADFFQRMKMFRKIAARFEKLVARFRGFAYPIARILIMKD
jgi:transposase